MTIYGQPSYVTPFFSRARLDSTPMLAQETILAELEDRSAEIEEHALLLSWPLPSGPSADPSNIELIFEALTVEYVAARKQYRLSVDVGFDYRRSVDAFVKRVEGFTDMLCYGQLDGAKLEVLPTYSFCTAQDVTTHLPGWGINEEPSPAPEEIEMMIRWDSALVFPLLWERGMQLGTPPTGKAKALLRDIVSGFVIANCVRARDWNQQAIPQSAERYEKDSMKLLNGLMAGRYDDILCPANIS